MALPAVLLKAKGALKTGSQVYNAGKSAKALQDSNISSVLALMPPALKLKIILSLVVTFFIIYMMCIPILMLIPKLDVMQGADSNYKRTNFSSGILNLTPEVLAEYYNLSEAAIVSPNTPDIDLASTEYETIDGFNEYIKTQVNSAGYGTRAAVVAAGIALIGDYIKATGKRLRYSQDGRQGENQEGIAKTNFYLDCSSFAWWAVYNGGFKQPSYPQTGSQTTWAQGKGYLKSVDAGQAGDFLINSGHIVMIIGSYDDGYYCAEFKGRAYGGLITQRSYSSLSLSGYSLIDMEDYYNNVDNVRG